MLLSTEDSIIFIRMECHVFKVYGRGGGVFVFFFSSSLINANSPVLAKCL
jgi:hypothetical protein